MLKLSPDGTRDGLARAIKEQEAHVETAEDSVNRQKSLISKFAREGLDVSTEQALLHDFETEFAEQKVKLGRLLYEAALARTAEAKKRSQPLSAGPIK